MIICMGNNTKVCLVSSCGGHFMELMRLLPAVDGMNFYIVTEKNYSLEEVAEQYPHYYLYQQQRHGKSFVLRFLANILLSFYFIVKERPTTVITTGAGAAFPTCLFAKLMFRKVIYVESFAKLNNKSVTGKLVYPIADEFFVQWPEMKSVYPKAKYYGSVY